jgi:transcriptional regulator
MSTQEAKDRLELLQGTLDLLILRTLIFGSQHGQGIARAIQQTSEEELLVEHGALYPALQRLEERGWISAKWGTSVNNRKARFYSLTPAGQKQLVKETTGSHRANLGISSRRELSPCSDANGKRTISPMKSKRTSNSKVSACAGKG